MKVAVNSRLLTRFSKLTSLTLILVGDEVIKYFKRINTNYELLEMPLKNSIKYFQYEVQKRIQNSGSIVAIISTKYIR